MSTWHPYNDNTPTRKDWALGCLGPVIIGPITLLIILGVVGAILRYMR